MDFGKTPFQPAGSACNPSGRPLLRAPYCVQKSIWDAAMAPEAYTGIPQRPRYPLGKAQLFL